ncbi:MAG: RluA family pseudouridine synthase [Pirellulaceae bacterium]|nr:RluA family pseudouridine synthase [Pirellulaceae bacterium]
MKKSFVIDQRVPAPARHALALVQSHLKVTRAIAAELLHDGLVSVNGKVVRQPHWRLVPGDLLDIEYTPQPAATPSKRKKVKRDPFEIAYDDEYLMLVVKPAGLLTVPTPKRESNTLLSNINRWLERQQPGVQAFSVHRLDRGVSGLLVFGKSLEMAMALREQFQQRKPKRKYTAIVVGQMESPSGTFRNYLATDADLNRYATDDPEGGELAITHYEVREQFGDSAILSVQLETGRRNQIRVHLADAGHPIIGDPRYKSDQARHRFWPHSRMGLHAETLGLKHPVTGDPLEFVAPWPQDFRDFRRKASRT